MTEQTIDEKLKSFVERIERLEQEKKDLLEDIRSIYLEAKGQGYDPRAMRQVIKLRKMSKAERDEWEFLITKYSEQMC